MNYLTIPHTTIQASQLCLGTGGLGSRLTQAESFALLDAFVAGGGTFLDTAHVYANWRADLPKSISEKTIGQWMRARGNRLQIIVGTKGAHPDLATMHISRLSPAEIVQDLNESLAHLQTDYIDLYWLHRDDPTRNVADIVETLNAQMRLGKIRAFGCSNWAPARIQVAQDYAVAHGLHGFAANQPMWSLAQPNAAAFGMPGLAAMDAQTWALHKALNLAAAPYTSQARGFFSKLAQLGADGLAEAERKSYLNEVNLRRFDRVQKLAADHDTTPSRIALAYLLAQPFPTFPVIGCRTIAQLADSLAAIAVTLSADEIAWLEA
ncbi:MAG: aldo/keto reductase [Caldilineaceae bacterium]